MSKPLTRVLFVDDEPLVLRAMARMVHPLRDQFETAFANSAEDALQMLTDKAFDVIVSDMRMPGMDGASLLEQAQRRFPGMARIILSGYAQYESAMRALPVSHRFLAKPVRSEELQVVLLRTVALHQMLDSVQLRELIGGAKDLPARPEVYFELRRVLSDNAASMKIIARTVERDAGITGRLLRAVNNAFFGPPQRVTSVLQAVQTLGTDTLTGLVLSLECFGNFEDTLAECELVPASLERKAYLAARIAADLLSEEQQKQDAFIAALLHDSGLLLLAARKPAMVSEAVALAKRDGIALFQAERALWGITHAQIGGYMLGLWGLPYPVVEAVAHCHTPAQHTVNGLDVAAAVYVAAAFADAAMSGDVADVMLDETVLQRVGLHGKVPELIALVERIIAREDPGGETPAAPLH